MSVIDTIYYLLENLLSEWLLQSSALPHIVQKVSSCAQFHNDDNMLLSFNRFIYFDNVIVPQFKQQVYFLHEFSLLNFISERLFVQ